MALSSLETIQSSQPDCFLPAVNPHSEQVFSDAMVEVGLQENASRECPVSRDPCRIFLFGP
ncbi:hypothetical protein BDW59DRAFT_79522 [Aspergillus cavernicola]|uniref:Uncharacterized protein n=1 Tax=Aspergillus cavernicola TaxID=176166 RepID=A0ABR4J053_9EURO